VAARDRRIAVLTENALAMPSPHVSIGRSVTILVGSGLLLAIALSLVGWAIVNLATPSAMTVWEDGVNEWFVVQRTPALDTLSQFASSLANSRTCIAVLVVMVVALRVWLGRWRESVALFAAIVGELLIFVAVTAVVARPRPDVLQLDVAPPTSSFPSGHMGAAVAFYGCIAVIMVRQLRPRWFAVTISTFIFLVPVLVGVSRIYRGMHHPVDVIFGAVCGGVWLALVLTTLLPTMTVLRAKPQREIAKPVQAFDAKHNPRECG